MERSAEAGDVIYFSRFFRLPGTLGDLFFVVVVVAVVVAVAVVVVVVVRDPHAVARGRSRWPFNGRPRLFPRRISAVFPFNSVRGIEFVVFFSPNPSFIRILPVKTR